MSVCPTGALTLKKEAEYRNWEVRKVLTTCPQCTTGCQFYLVVKDNKIDFYIFTIYINACVRSESGTDRVARALLGKITDKYDEIKLSEIHLQPLSEEELNKRTAYIEKGKYSNPMFAPAKQFADAA